MIYPDFPFSEQLVVSDHPGSGYQAKITVYCYPGMCYDFRDIRFHDSQNNIIPYWIESQTDGSTATVWVKLTASRIISLRWGNGEAVSESNGKAVYELFDDFTGVNGATPDSTEWTCESSDGSGIIQLDGNGNVTITATQNSNACAALISKKYLSQGIIIEISDKISNNYYIDTMMGEDALQAENGGTTGWWHPTLGDGFTFLIQTGDGVDAGAIKQTFDTTTPTLLSVSSEKSYTALDTYYTHTYIWAPSLIAAKTGTTTTCTTSTNITGSYRVAFAVGKYSTEKGGTRTIQYVKVRKYTATEPTFTPLSSQYYLPISAELFSGAETPTYIYPIISYNEENEMFQIVSTIKAHPFQIRSLTTGDLATTCTGTVTVTVRKFTAGGTVTIDTTTLDSDDITAYNNDMLTFYLTVPASLAATSYDSLEINVSCDEGEGFLMVNIVPAPSTIATAVWTGTEGAAVHTATTSTLTLAAINAEVDTAISDFNTATPIALTADITEIKGATWTDETLVTINTAADAVQAVTDTVGGEFDATNELIGAISIGESGGAEKVVPAAYYQLDASENTITLLTPYNGITVEQILSIFDLTVGAEIYNCLNPRKRRSFKTDPEEQVGIDISVGSGATAGVISYIEDAKGIADTDKLMIVVNTP